MGRRPNPLISQWFMRGTKLNDNSNRYPHTCRACGENFPKGRLDSLTNHLTKKCPAISENDRISVCLAMNGIRNPAEHVPMMGAPIQHQSPSGDVSMNQAQNWTALETLAEVSRHFKLSDKPQDANAAMVGAGQGGVLGVPGIPNAPGASAMAAPTSVDPTASSSHATAVLNDVHNDPEGAALAAALTTAPPAESIAVYQSDRFDLHEQFPLENSPVNFDGRAQQEKTGMLGQPALFPSQTPQVWGQGALGGDNAQQSIEERSVDDAVRSLREHLQNEFFQEHNQVPGQCLGHSPTPNTYYHDQNQVPELSPGYSSTPSMCDGEGTNGQAAHHSPIETKDLTTEEQMELLQAVENVSGANGASRASENLNMAAAAAAAATAAARANNQSLVDPQLFANESRNASTAASVTAAAAASTADPGHHPDHPPAIAPAASDNSDPMDIDPILSLPQAPPPMGALVQGRHLTPQPPSMASMTSTWKNPPFGSPSVPHHQFPAGHLQAQVPPMPARGGFRLEPGMNGNRGRHSRARFDASRRKEVQEVRKIGACIRCRILRKMCSKGDPCDTCKKVLAPRVWHTGCVRTKLQDHLKMYAAGVQAVHSQNNVNRLQLVNNLKADKAMVEIAHFPDTGIHIAIGVLDRVPISSGLDAEVVQGAQDAQGAQEDTHDGQDKSENPPTQQLETKVVMIDYENEDLPRKIESYVKALLPTFITSESSHFARLTLETAQQVAHQTNDDCLNLSLELWGYIEVMDRERSWNIIEKRAGADSRPISSADKPYDTICLQLAAAAERKAGATSKALLHSMQKLLQDSKVKIGFPMFLASIILLHCVEKSTWAFMAWGQDNLLPMWPLKDVKPSDFTSQGPGLAGHVQMLLLIRRALPRTARQEPGGLLVTEEQDPDTQHYFQSLQLNVDYVERRQHQQTFSPTDSRSLELAYCSILLLPHKEDSM